MFFFFNPKLKQTKVGQVKLNRLNDGGGDRHLCFHYKKKGIERDEQEKKIQEEHCHKRSMNIFTVRDL